MDKHTKGPWYLDYQGGYGRSGVYCHDPLFCGQPLASVHLPQNYESGSLSQRAFDTADANALVIVAAPESLECAELLESLCVWPLHRFGPDSPEGKEASFRLQKAVAAISKARGL